MENVDEAIGVVLALTGDGFARREIREGEGVATSITRSQTFRGRVSPKPLLKFREDLSEPAESGWNECRNSIVNEMTETVYKSTDPHLRLQWSFGQLCHSLFPAILIVV